MESNGNPETELKVSTPREIVSELDKYIEDYKPVKVVYFYAGSFCKHIGQGRHQQYYSHDVAYKKILVPEISLYQVLEQHQQEKDIKPCQYCLSRQAL